MDTLSKQRQKLVVALRDKTISRLKGIIKAKDDQLDSIDKLPITKILNAELELLSAKLEEIISTNVAKNMKHSNEEIVGHLKKLLDENQNFKKILIDSIKDEIKVSVLADVPLPKSIKISNLKEIPKPIIKTEKTIIKFPDTIKVKAHEPLNIIEEEPSSVIFERNDLGFITLLKEIYEEFTAVTTFKRDSRGLLVSMKRTVNLDEPS